MEALCRRRPELADELRRLAEDYIRAEEAVGKLRGASAVEEPSDDLVAEALEQLGRPDDPGTYEDRGPVARGGMGEVRRVLDARLQRTLAMKVLPLERTAGVGPLRRRRRVARFLEEAQIAGGLQHPAIVPVHALGISRDGRLYFTMPLIEGDDFARIIERVHAGDEEWGLGRAVGVIIRVCEGMDYAHSRRVIHRDLKPSNVMVGRFGEVHVMDWGLAKVLEPSSSRDRPAAVPQEREDPVPGAVRRAGLRTMDGDVVGTPCYMSPEQAEGRVHDVGALSDVYSVGCVLFHLLTGRPPYASEDGSETSAFEVLARLKRGPPETALELAPHASPELAAICERAMARRPADRYADMRALARDLRAWRDGRVVRAFETGAWAEARKWVGRNRGLAAALGGILLAAVGGLAGIAYVQARSGRAVRSANFELEGANRELRRSLYFNNVALAQSALESFSTSNLRALLDDCPPELRGWEWRYLWRLSDSSLRTLEGHADTVVDVEFTPDGTRLVSGSRDGRIVVWDVARGEELRAIEGHDDMVEALAVSPDGALVASGSRDHTVRVWDLETGAELVRLEGHSDILGSVAFSPDGSRLVSGAFDDEVLLWDLETQRATRLAGEQVDVLSVDWSPDGDRIASGSFDGVLLIWDANSLELLHTIRAGGDYRINGVCFSPDSRRVVVASQDRKRRVWAVETGEEVRRLAARTGALSAGFTPDGRSLVSPEFGAIQLWNVEREDRGSAFLGHSAPIFDAVCSPDGRLMASGSEDHTVRLWDVTRDPAVLTLDAGGENVHSIVFSSDSRLVAWGGRNGRIELREARGGRRVAGWDSGQGWVLSLAFHPDGRRLASGGQDGSVRLWDLTTEELVGALPAHANWVRSVAFDRSGERLVSSSEDGVAKLWDLAEGTELARFSHSLGLVNAGFDPRSDRVLTSGWEGIVRLWDPSEPEPVLEIDAHSAGACFASFSPDGDRIATGGGDRVLRIWDSATGEPLLENRGHERSVTSIRFSSDGERLFSCGWDGMLKVWDARTGTLAMTLQADEHPLRSLDISPDGERIAVSGVGHRVYVWSAESAIE